MSQLKHSYLIDMPHLKVEVLEADAGVRIRRTVYNAEEFAVSQIDFTIDEEARLLAILLDRANARQGVITSGSIN